jgi:hypothetical protein
MGGLEWPYRTLSVKEVSTHIVRNNSTPANFRTVCAYHDRCNEYIHELN